GAVAGRPVRARDLELLVVLDRDEQPAEQVRRVARLQAGAKLRVGPDRIEVAQRDGPQRAGGRAVLESLLYHDLGAGVRVGRRQRGGLVDREVRTRRIDGAGRAEQVPGDPV